MVARYKNGSLGGSTRQKHLKRISCLKFYKTSLNDYVSSAGDANISAYVASNDENIIETGNAGVKEITDDIDNERTWLEGRRIVEMAVLLTELRNCKNCFNSLNIINIENETKMGLGSLFYIKCEHCLVVNKVASGKRHNGTGDSGSHYRYNIFDVNTKLAAAMINAGIGEQQMNNVLSYLNLPTISHVTLKKREREIGTSIISVAKESCKDSIKEEIQLLHEVNSTLPDDEKVLPQLGSDGGWQQRGSGRNYNSQSGHVTVFGKLSKKCVSYSVAKKNCRFCTVAKASKKAPTAHKCSRNWNGSSKAMEPFLTMQCLQDVQANGLSVAKLAMDDDTSTFVRAKKSLFPHLEKISDRNHVLKNFTSGLYKLRDVHKSLTVQTINYLKKCVSYATVQNKGSPGGIRENIQAIVPHAFGDHSKCNESWCKGKTKPNYSHSSLPDGSDLTDQPLRTALQDFFKTYTSLEMAYKLANLGSTNRNESLNNMISKKAPKNVNYSESESLDTRIAAAIAQKNEGHKYVLNVNHLHGLSPGRSTRRVCETLDTRRRRKAERAITTEQKRRRIQLKEERYSGASLREVEEGATYATGISHVDSSICDMDIEDIPVPPVPPPVQTDIQYTREEIVVFDIETTGLSVDSNIIQLAAVHKSSGKEFNTFIAPAGGFVPSKIISLTGIACHLGVVYHNSLPVHSVPVQRALSQFVTWLNDTCPQAVLVAHNAKFDSRMLINACERYNVQFPPNKVRFFKERVCSP